MCSICGIFDFEDNNSLSCARMNETMRHRGPDGSGEFFEGSVCFAHNRLAVMDIESGAQPMSITHEGKKYTIVYNGELYNMPELKKELASFGITPKPAVTPSLFCGAISYGTRDARRSLTEFSPLPFMRAERTEFFWRATGLG